MKRACTHCHLEFDEKALITEQEGEETLYFCCKGCQGVYHLLQDSGLTTFYDKLGSNTLEPPKTELEDAARYDSPAVMTRYVKEKEGLCEIALIIEGIHCAACVWLNEKVLHQQDGIIEASINYTNNKAKILWDPDKITLSGIITTIRSIGYDAKPYDPATQESGANAIRRDYYTRMIVGIFCTMNIMWIAVAQYAGYFTGIERDMKSILNVAEWILATPTLFYSGWIFFKGAWAGLRHRIVNMDLLVITGALLTYLYSIYATITVRGETYFESTTMIITFILIGKFLEKRSKKGAVDILDKLNATLPLSATVIRQGERLEIKPESILVDDLIELKPGERAPVDGILLNDAQLDESSLTGESRPVTKSTGSTIISGTIGLDSLITYRATRDFASSTLHTLVNMVEDSLTKRPKIEITTGRLSEYFSITILLLSLLTFIGWYLSGSGFENSFVTAVAVIIIACPCALALATPVATLIGVSRALEQGVVFKEARHIETMAKANRLLLDKTGTITTGKPKIVSEQLLANYDPSHLAALVSTSSHPISRTIFHHFQSKNTLPEKGEGFRQIPGKGMTGVIQGQTVAGGNRALMQELGISAPEEGEHLRFYYAEENVLKAIFEFSDTLRPEAAKSLQEIHKLGLELEMVTGDHAASASKIADMVGITRYHSQLLPEDKAAYVERSIEEGHIVVMAGDGINDALALTKSDIAIAMGGGTDLAIQASDVVVLDDQLTSLKEAFLLAHQTYRNIKQNLAISLLYNAITIPLAMAGYIIPLIAAISMSFSSLLVVGNSMRIKMKRK